MKSVSADRIRISNNKKAVMYRTTPMRKISTGDI